MSELKADQQMLEKANLSLDDQETVEALSRDLDLASPMAAYNWGKDVATATSEYADSMLDTIQTRELEHTGEQLQDIIHKAQSVNYQPSEVPVVGPLIDKVRHRASKVRTEFNSARESIDKTVGEIAQTQQSLQQRIEDLEGTYQNIQQEAHTLGQYIAAGELAKQRIDDQIETLEGETQTQETIQRISDLKSLKSNMDKRITDLSVLQQNAYNTLPEIRMIQNNNALLVDKYHSIINTTIPLWKQQMVLGLALEEQKQAVGMANEIDDFTNQMLKDHSQQLKKNTINTAKANQRNVIDVETINEVQNTLIETVQSVNQIQAQSSKKNEKTRAKVLSLRSNLNKVLVNETPEPENDDNHELPAAEDEQREQA